MEQTDGIIPAPPKREEGGIHYPDLYRMLIFHIMMKNHEYIIHNYVTIEEEGINHFFKSNSGHNQRFVFLSGAPETGAEDKTAPFIVKLSEGIN